MTDNTGVASHEAALGSADGHPRPTSGRGPAGAIPNAVLLARLREVESNRGCIVTGVSTCWHRNPEGPEAADVIEALYEALSDLLENPAYQTAIGGNPNAVDEMLARAFAALRKARGDS